MQPKKDIDITLYRDTWFSLDPDITKTSSARKTVRVKPTEVIIRKILKQRGEFTGWTVDRKTRRKLVQLLEGRSE